MEDGEFERCGNEGTIISTSSNAGGIFGYEYCGSATIMKECYNAGIIKGNNAGGLCGEIDTWHKDTINISNCYNIGRIIVPGGGRAGGIVYGDSGIKDNLTISKFYNAGIFQYLEGKNNVVTDSITGKPGIKSEIYYLNTIDNTNTESESVSIDEEKLKSDLFAEELGELWIQSGKGYPMLKWQQNKN